MKYSWLVEKYLEGEMSGEELHRFEREILTNPEVAREVNRIRSMNRFMKEQHLRMMSGPGLIEEFEDMENVLLEDEISRELEGLKINKISAVRKEISAFRTKITELNIQDTLSRNNSSKILVKRVSVWFAAAMFIALLALSSVLFLGGDDIDHRELYSAYFIPPQADILRDNSASANDAFTLAMKAYTLQDYGTAFQFLEEVNEQRINNKYFFFRGITAMHLERYPLAIESFGRLEMDPQYRQDAMWYKSLCYLGLEDKTATRYALTEIIRSDGYYRNRAKSLRRKL